MLLVRVLDDAGRLTVEASVGQRARVLQAVEHLLMVDRTAGRRIVRRRFVCFAVES